MVAQEVKVATTATVRVEKVRMSTEEYSVFQARPIERGKEMFTAKIGTGPVAIGQTWMIAGAWGDHPRYGRQFSAFFAALAKPSTPADLDHFLMSGLVPGWKSGHVQALRAHPDRVKMVAMVEKDPSFLVGYAGITEAMVVDLLDVWNRAERFVAMYSGLAEWDISGKTADNLVRVHRTQTIARLTDDPYEDIFGVPLYTWKKAEVVANRLGIESDDPRRVTAGFTHAVKEATWSEGHTWLYLTDALSRSSELLHVPSLVIEAQLDAELTQGKIVQEEEQVFPRELHEAEWMIASSVAKRLDSGNDSGLGLEPQDICADLLSGEQRYAVCMALNSRISLLTGGPGVGKTSTIRQIVKEARSRNIPITLMAPTGKAALRMTEATEYPATTIHRRIRLTPGASSSQVGPNALTGLVVVDEVSMLDTLVAAAVFDATAPSANLLLVGDPDQLPSVGPGAVLRDLISFAGIPHARLSKVFRNDAGIALNAARIREGEPIMCMPDCDIVSADCQEQAAIIIQELIQEHGHERTLVLTPTNGGASGRIYLNEVLQDICNPGDVQDGVGVSHVDPGTLDRSYQSIRTGDKVMVTKNDAELGVFNGQTGVVSSISPRGGIVVSLDGEVVTFKTSERNLLTLAYAITGHKSQGSEEDTVIIPVFPSRVLCREWLYTVLTRAKKRCILVGDVKAIQGAIGKVRLTERRTGLLATMRTVVD
jgi:exodeoxyribonuclease V alpha subunit